MDNINKQVKDKTEGITINKPLTLEEERVWLDGVLKKIKNKKEIFLAFEHNNRIIGSCSVERNQGREDHIAFLGISIEKEYRRQEIATQAIPILFSLAKKRMKGLKIVSLYVFSYNKPAQKTYEKLGFKKVGVLPDAAINKGKLYDKYVMYHYLEG